MKSQIDSVSMNIRSSSSFFCVKPKVAASIAAPPFVSPEPLCYPQPADDNHSTRTFRACLMLLRS